MKKILRVHRDQSVREELVISLFNRYNNETGIQLGLCGQHGFAEPEGCPYASDYSGTTRKSGQGLKVNATKTKKMKICSPANTGKQRLHSRNTRTWG